MREQAALSAEEITTNSIYDFIADSEKEDVQEKPLDFSTVSRPMSDIIFETLSPPKTPEELKLPTGARAAPKVNGKHNKNVQHSNSTNKWKISSRDNDITKLIIANTARPRDVLPGLESWQTSKIAAWHSIEGSSIQWLCVVCIDRRGKVFVRFAISFFRLLNSMLLIIIWLITMSLL